MKKCLLAATHPKTSYWRAREALTDQEQAVRDIQEGIKDEAAGRTRPISEIDAAIREELGFLR